MLEFKKIRKIDSLTYLVGTVQTSNYNPHTQSKAIAIVKQRYRYIFNNHQDMDFPISNQFESPWDELKFILSMQRIDIDNVLTSPLYLSTNFDGEKRFCTDNQEINQVFIGYLVAETSDYINSYGHKSHEELFEIFKSNTRRELTELTHFINSRIYEYVIEEQTYAVDEQNNNEFKIIPEKSKVLYQKDGYIDRKDKCIADLVEALDPSHIDF